MMADPEGWMAMDLPVHDAFRATGPHGYMEFGEGCWRMHYPDGSIWFPPEDPFEGARIKFWDCPEDHPREPQRVRIVWDGDLATCQDCGRTNRD